MPHEDLARRPVATYSIVARDSDSGALGVAVQSHWFSVGALVPWAEAGVGAVATQSFVDVSYGPLGLAGLRDARSPDEVLGSLLAEDSTPEVRQVAMIDARGRAAAHTGERCIVAAGQVVGEGFSVQANMMRSEAVWPRMADAFQESEGDLAERLLLALDAAERAGGDIRGRQSAALLVVSGERGEKPWQGRLVELRVEDHPDPLGELRRLLTIHRAYDCMNRGDEALAANDFEAALREYDRAREIHPTNPELGFWVGITLASRGRVDEGARLLHDTYDADPSWRELVSRLPAAGLLPDDDDLVRRLTGRE